MNGEPMARPIEIFIDADACPVKDEVYKVAQRYGLKTWVVANAFMAVPRSDLVAVFATGLTGLNANGSVGEMLRLNLDVAAKSSSRSQEVTSTPPRLTSACSNALPNSRSFGSGMLS